MRYLQISALQVNRVYKEQGSMVSAPSSLGELGQETGTWVLSSPWPELKISRLFPLTQARGGFVPCRTQQMLKRLCQAFCFVLSSPSAKCSIWVTFLLHRGLLMKQTLKIIILLSSNFLIWQAHLFGILGYSKGLFFVSLVLIMHRKLHILMYCHLKVQLNISESGRTFEDIPLLFFFFFLLLLLSFLGGFLGGFFKIYLPAKASVMLHLGDASCPFECNDEPVELHGCLERMCEIQVTHPAGASARRIYSLRGHLADILYSWWNNAFRAVWN